MKKFKEKVCECGTVFTPTAPAQKMCVACKEVRKEAIKEYNRKYSYEKWADKARSSGRSHAIGVGRGGSNKKGIENKQYISGEGFFSRMRPLIKKDRRYCENCSKDLMDAKPFEWCVHHKDGNRSNNTVENYQLLCKSCHQVAHECHLNFKKEK